MTNLGTPTIQRLRSEVYGITRPQGIYELRNAVKKVMKPKVKRYIKKNYEHVDIKTLKKNYVKNKSLKSKALVVAKILASLTENELNSLNEIIKEKIDII